MSGRLATFVSCARALGRTPAEKAAILWRLSKNARVRLGLSRYHPDDVYGLPTRLGTVWLRDNFGDVTNLPGLLVRNEYQVSRLAGEGVVYDVGANIGLFSRWILHHNPGRVVHAFEPLPGNVAMARRNNPGAIVNQVGLGREPATVSLGVDQHGIMATAIPQRWDTPASEFRVIRLDDYTAEHRVERVVFMKIDTEGMELDVLDGAPETLRRTGSVAMETHGDERHQGARDRLTAAGFTIDTDRRHGGTGLLIASRPETPGQIRA